MATIQEMLAHMTDVYNQKTSSQQNLKIQLTIMPENETWFLSIRPGEPSALVKSLPTGKPQIKFKLIRDTLEQIYSGEMTGFTAIGRENISDKTPLDFELGPNIEMTPEVLNQFYKFVQLFFNPTHPETIVLDKAHSRLVHGAWALPLFYHTGFRSGYYQIEKGQKLNEPEDTNPFQQAFIIISGTGYAKLGDNVVGIGAGEAYFIPPGSDHVVWTEEETPLSLIYLAWGDKA